MKRKMVEIRQDINDQVVVYIKDHKSRYGSATQFINEAIIEKFDKIEMEERNKWKPKKHDYPMS